MWNRLVWSVFIRLKFSIYSFHNLQQKVNFWSVIRNLEIDSYADEMMMMRNDWHKILLQFSRGNSSHHHIRVEINLRLMNCFFIFSKLFSDSTKSISDAIADQHLDAKPNLSSIEKKIMVQHTEPCKKYLNQKERGEFIKNYSISFSISIKLQSNIDCGLAQSAIFIFYFMIGAMQLSLKE